MKKKTVLLVLILLALLLAGSYVVAYWIAVKSEAYETSLGFISENQIIVREIGTIRTARLRLFGYSIRYQDSRASASFEIAVTGERASSIAHIELEKQDARWKVVSAKLSRGETLVNILKP